MVQAFGQGFPGDHDLRARLALPLDPSQMRTPRIPTISVSAKHPAYPGPRVTSGYPTSCPQSRSVPSNYTLPSNLQPFPLPPQDPSTHSSPMYFNDYLKLHNQLAIPLPLQPVHDSIYTSSSHGVMPNTSAPGYPTSPPQQRYSHGRSWSDATSSHQSNLTTSMALDDNTGDSWPYHLASVPTVPSEMPRGRGPHGDPGPAQAQAHGPSLPVHRNYSSPQQPEEPASSSTYKYQTWEELARELGFQNK